MAWPKDQTTAEIKKLKLNHRMVWQKAKTTVETEKNK